MELNFFPAGILVSLIIGGSLIFYYIYYYLIHSGVLTNLIENSVNPHFHEITLFLSKKTAGFLILGVIPAFLFFGLSGKPLQNLGLSFEKLISNSILILILSVIIVLILFVSHRVNPDKNTLEFDIKTWTGKQFLINCLGWVLYLTGYEILFRGILLMACYSSFGLWPAIAINVAIYSAIHMVKGKEQAIGAIFFGTTACYFALTRETIWIPLIMHIVLSLFSDYFSIRFNKELKFVNVKLEQ